MPVGMELEQVNAESTHLEFLANAPVGTVGDRVPPRGNIGGISRTLLAGFFI